MKLMIGMILIAGAALAQEARPFVHAVLVSSTGEVRDECDSKVIAKIETDGSVTGDAAKALALIVRALSKAYPLPAK